MIKRLKKLFPIELIIVTVLLCANLQSFAQTEPASSEEKATVTVTGDNGQEDTVETTNQQQDETTKNEDTNKGIETQARTKHSLAYEILGRELTRREKDNYGDGLSTTDLKNILAGEQRLVIVRALITVGADDSVKGVLDVYPVSKLQTYSELVERFSGLTEKYGSVKAGIESEYVYNIKDDGQAFKKAASKAYETVFGIPEDKQNKDQIFNFLTQSNALTYSKMIQVLMKTITPDVKKQILFNALDQIGRSDLKTSDKFVKKMLAQQFTYANLMKLFQELKDTAPAQPAQEKDIQKK